jgi:hypothetical protein
MPIVGSRNLTAIQPIVQSSNRFASSSHAPVVIFDPWHRPRPFDSRAAGRHTYLYDGGSGMPMTVRLSAKTERAVSALARRRGQTRSDVVRDALEHYTATNAGDAGRGRPYDAWVDVIGLVALGARNQERTTGEQFTTMVREKAHARRAR